jgi:hypothetical protein
VLSSDDARFGGHDRARTDDTEYFTQPNPQAPLVGMLTCYLPSRTGLQASRPGAAGRQRKRPATQVGRRGVGWNGAVSRSGLVDFVGVEALALVVHQVSDGLGFVVVAREVE